MSTENLDFSGLFKLDVLIHLDVKSYSFYELGLQKFLCLASQEEISFIYIDSYGERFTRNKTWDFIENPIDCMCFEPTGTWLVVVSSTKIALVPFLPFLINNSAFDHKWSHTAVTTLSLHIASNPTSVVWWLTQDLENVLIIGSKEGFITFYSLDSTTILGNSKVSPDIIELQICIDDSLDLIVLLITGTNSQQWKLVLEHRSLGYSWLQHCRNNQQENKDIKKDGLIAYIRQFSKDKITLFAQGTSRDGTIGKAVEYMVNPTEYLPLFRKGSNVWALSAQYVNGRHFISAFDTDDGTLVLESTEEGTPSRTLCPQIKKKCEYRQGLWSQRLIYLLTKNELEVHSSNFSVIQGDAALDSNRDNTLLWSAELIGEAQRGFVMCPREPSNTESGWRQPTFLCDLQLPRFNLEPCLIITSHGAYIVNTVSDPCEWLVGLIMRGGVGAEKYAEALGAPVSILLRAAADMLLSRSKVTPAHYLYTLSQSPLDGWIARLGVFGRLQEIINFKQSGNSVLNLGNSANTIKLLAQLFKLAVGSQENIEIDSKYTTLGAVELEELCSFTVALGLWNVASLFSINCGYPALLLSAINKRKNLCRGALNCILKEIHLLTPILEEDEQFFFEFIVNNCSSFDVLLLKHLAIWLCPLQDQLRPVMRDLKQGISNLYTNHILHLIKTFMHVICALDSKGPKVYFRGNDKQEVDSWKVNISPRRSLSCGLTHWAISDGGNAKIMMTDTVVKPELIGRVINVACGRHHTIVLTENGLYAAGDNTYGQLGIGKSWLGATGDNATSSGSLMYVPQTWSAPLATISAGHYHSAALDVSGRLYTWGWGVHGQLGLGSIEDEVSPKLLTKLQGRKVISVGCGACHTLALMKNGEVWVWGAGVFGQLGGGARSKSSIPVRVASLPDPIELIAVGYFHNLALSVKGQLWTWGSSPQAVRAAHARRCASPTAPVADPCSETHLLPTIVDMQNIQGNIVQMACGWHHSCILNNSGTLYSWGLNFDGQLGSGDRKQIQIPTEVKICSDNPANVIDESSTNMKTLAFSKVVDKSKTTGMVACGGDFTVFVDDDGKIYVTGNTHQQVTDGPKPSNRIIMMKTTKRVIKIPANRSNNKFIFQPFERLDKLFNYNDVKRDPLSYNTNPLSSLEDFDNESWIGNIVISLKPWINKDYAAKNLNVAAKIAYHDQMFQDSFRFSLENLSQKCNANVFYFKHLENKGTNKFTNIDLQKACVSNILTARIKEICMAMLNEQVSPIVDCEIFRKLPCLCNELEYFPNILDSSTNNSCDLALKTAYIIERCFSTFPADANVWEDCIAFAKNFYNANNLPISELESVLRKHLENNVPLMASAIMFSKECDQYNGILSPKFFLNMTSKFLDTWG